MSDEELVAMARLAQRDDRMSTGALYGHLADRIEALTKEREKWRRAAETRAEGWKISDDARIEAEAKLAKAVEALELCPPDKPQLTDEEFRAAVNTWWKLYARATLADIKSYSKKTITEWPLEEGNIMVGEMK